MKVFIFGSPGFGGHEIMAIKILRVVLERGTCVTCFVNDANSRLLEELCKLDVNVMRFPFVESKLDLVFGSANPYCVSLAVTMRRELQARNAQHVILINGNAVANHRATLGILQACKRLSVRSTVYIPMVHTAAELGLPRSKALFYTRAVKRGIGLSSDVLVISETWKKRVEWLCPAQSTYVVHNLVDLASIPPARASQPSRIPVRLCFIGRYDRKQKGLDFLFEAFALLSAHGNVTIDLVGDGDDRPFVEDAIGKLPASVGARVRQHGWVGDPLRILNQCDALLMPSRVEGAPLVALEARRLGLPVFAFDVPGVNDIVPSHYLSPPFDVLHFTKNILNGGALAAVQKTGQDDEIQKYFDPVRFADEVCAALAIT